MFKIRKISDLKKLPGNPRIIKDADFKKLCKSIKDNPDYFQARPLILSDRTGELVVIAGNQRLEACISLGIEDAPTFLLSGLTEKKEREVVIRDNVNNGSWNFDVLANEWDEIELGDWGVEIPNVEPPDIDFDEIEGNEDRKQEFKIMKVCCPSCEHEFDVQI